MGNSKKHYLHIKYSHDGKTFSENNGKKITKWVGQYISDEEKDSDNFNDYKWLKK